MNNKNRIAAPLSAINFQQLKRGVMVQKAAPNSRLLIFIGKKCDQKKIDEAHRKKWDTAFIDIDDQKIKLLETTPMVFSFHFNEGTVELMSMKTCIEEQGIKHIEASKKENLETMNRIKQEAQKCKMKK